METMDEIQEKIKVENPELFSQVEKVVPFHGFLSSGALIGIHMLNIAKRVLDIKEGERIYALSETYNCIPDPFQILEGSTTGNKRLRVHDTGKMAVTVNKQAPSGIASVKGVRIYLDPEKTKDYPKLHAWYMNTKKLRHEEVVPVLLEAGENIYSYEMVDIDVPVKKKKTIKLCQKCNESFIQRNNEVLCDSCNNSQTETTI